MTRPRRFLVRMALFLGAVTVILGLLFGPLREAFLANIPLNGLILGVLLMGIFYNVRQVIQLYPETDWIESFRRDHSVMSLTRDPKLLAPMATMLGEQGRPLKLSAMSMRSLLDGISARLEESRDISRYTIGLLIFLGLLGTFWGLLQTVSAVGDVIAGLAVEGGDLATMFGDLKSGLAAPLSGMGTAFSTSLFGLGGSLVLGFLDLQAGQAQNQFYNHLEDWLSSLTRLSSGSLSADGDQSSVPAYVQALLEQSAESLENLQRTLIRGEEHRISANDNMMALMEKLETLTDHMRAEQALMMRLAENQIDMKPILSRLSEMNLPTTGELDEATRAHIRNLDVYMARLVDDISAGREQIIQQVRSEIKLLARTIAATAEEAER
jgi:hypothetical protein